MKQQTGFTLTELLVVIAIIGIIASIAIPSFESMIERNRLKEAVTAVEADLQFARNRAIKQSENVFLTTVVGNTGAWCVGVSAVTPTCDCLQATGDVADDCEMKRTLGSNFSTVNINSTTSVSRTFDFRRGTVVAGNIILSTNDYSARIVVSGAGRIRTCAPTTLPAGTVALPGLKC